MEAGASQVRKQRKRHDCSDASCSWISASTPESISLKRLAKSPAPEVKAVSHPNSRELGGIESSPLIAIHFSRLRSRAEAPVCKRQAKC